MRDKELGLRGNVSGLRVEGLGSWFYILNPEPQRAAMPRTAPHPPPPPEPLLLLPPPHPRPKTPAPHLTRPRRFPPPPPRRPPLRPRPLMRCEQGNCVLHKKYVQNSKCRVKVMQPRIKSFSRGQQHLADLDVADHRPRLPPAPSLPRDTQLLASQPPPQTSSLQGSKTCGPVYPRSGPAPR